MSLWTSTAADLVARTASADPTPGGGSVACICGAMGTALMAMALEITARSPSGDRADEIEATLAQLRAVIAAVQRHADRDVEVFEAYMAALALPRTDPAAAQARKAALAEAALGATEAPLAAAADLVLALAAAAVARGLAKRQVASDVLAGADLVHGAVHAALRNVDINLPGIADPVAASELAERREQLALRADELHAGVISASV
jgi:formiminotetrahydrofolate cyclodeaminase